METEKRLITVKRSTGKSFPAVLRDYGDYYEVTPWGTFFVSDGCKMVQNGESIQICCCRSISGKAVPDDDPNFVELSFPPIRYKIPKNFSKLDMSERENAVAEQWFEKVQKIVSYYFMGFNESVKKAGNPEEMLDHDAVLKILEEIKTKMVEELIVKKRMGVISGEFAEGKIIEEMKKKIGVEKIIEEMNMKMEVNSGEFAVGKLIEEIKMKLKI